MNKIINWFFGAIVKSKRFKYYVEIMNAEHSIAYKNWTDSLAKNGWPRNPNGTMMDCWELYDFYKNRSGKMNIYLKHARRGK